MSDTKDQTKFLKHAVATHQIAAERLIVTYEPGSPEAAEDGAVAEIEGTRVGGGDGHPGLHGRFPTRRNSARIDARVTARTSPAAAPTASCRRP